MFSSEDIKQLRSLGIEQSVAEQQIDNFKKGFSFLKTTAPATAGKGIVKLKDDKVKAYINRFDKFEGTLLKFTPASGAASRMFKSLFEVKETMENNAPIDWNSKNMKPVKRFFENLRKFAFYSSLQNVLLERGINIDAIGGNKRLDTLKALLDEDGLN
jgi:hypothetical protein